MAAAVELHYVVAEGDQSAGVGSAFLRRRDLKPGPKLLYQVLLDVAVGERAFAGLAELAAWTAVSVDTVERQLKRLEELGLVRAQRLGKTLANVYTLVRSREEVIPQIAPRSISNRGQIAPTPISERGQIAVPMDIHGSMYPLTAPVFSEEDAEAVSMEPWSHGEKPRARPQIAPGSLSDEGQIAESLQPELIGPGEAAPPPPPSVAIDERSDRLSLELCDPGNLPQNRARLRRLWAGSGLAERAFLELVEVARARTLRWARKSRVAAAYPASNRFPYFGTVLEGLVHERAAHDAATGAQGWRQTYRTAELAPDLPRGRPEGIVRPAPERRTHRDRDGPTRA